MLRSRILPVAASMSICLSVCGCTTVIAPIRSGTGANSAARLAASFEAGPNSQPAPDRRTQLTEADDIHPVMKSEPVIHTAELQAVIPNDTAAPTQPQIVAMRAPEELSDDTDDDDGADDDEPTLGTAAAPFVFHENYASMIEATACPVPQGTASRMTDEQKSVMTATVASEDAQKFYLHALAQNSKLQLCPAPLSNAHDSHYNSSGESFLYTHRLMWNHFQHALAESKNKCFAGWSRLPIATMNENSAKSTQLIDWQATLADDDWLSSHSLSQLGWALEFGIFHNALEMYSGPALSEKNWLLDPQRASMNPVYWQLHGYIEHVLQAWLNSHDKSKLSDTCGAESACYAWSKTVAQAASAQAKSAPSPVKSPSGKVDTVALTKFFNLGRLTSDDLNSGDVAEADDDDTENAKPSRNISSAATGDDPFEFASHKVCQSR